MPNIIWIRLLYHLSGMKNCNFEHIRHSGVLYRAPISDEGQILYARVDHGLCLMPNFISISLFCRPLAAKNRNYVVSPTDGVRRKMNAGAHTHTHTHNHFSALWILSSITWVRHYQKKHSPTHLFWSLLILYILPPSTYIHGILHGQLTCPSFFAQSLYKSPLVYLSFWHPSLHTPYISSPNHCLLFAAHAHTIATCFAVVLTLYHLILISLSTHWNSIFYLNAIYPSDHSHLCLWNATSFSVLTGQVSLPCNILLNTNLPLTINYISLLVSNGTKSLNLFHPIQILAATAASAEHVT